MEYLNVLIGNKEMYIPVNDKLGKTMLLAHKRLNYEKYIARMRHFGNGKMVAERVEISSDFFYALEDILNEQGYPEVIHHLFGNFSIDEQKVLPIVALITNIKSKNANARCGISRNVSAVKINRRSRVLCRAKWIRRWNSHAGAKI